jgi:hypothetical protein
MRLKRALANPRTSGAQIRAIAAELPQIGLEDALAITLGLLDREPDSFSRFAARWGARLVQERRLELEDAQLAFAALGALDGRQPRAGVEALAELTEAVGLRTGERLLLDWLKRRDGQGSETDRS